MERSLSPRQLLKQTVDQLESAEAELLLSHVLQRNRAWIWAHLDDPLDAKFPLDTFRTLIAQRASGQPIAYLVGTREFYGRDFLVSPDVLIPRPETELLVDLALQLLPKKDAQVLDIGTGSGAIALTLAAERPTWAVSATDISRAALTIAAKNRSLLGLAQVEFIHSDLFNAITDMRFDLIISNPPYIAEGDPHLERGDLRFEPGIALSCGEDGLALIRSLSEQSINALKPGGWILIEHGYDQAAAVRAQLEADGFNGVQSWTDLAGIQRVSGGRQPGWLE